MILNYEEGHYIDVDKISSLRLFEDKLGVAVVDGQKITLSKEQFQIIEKALKWRFNLSIYNKNLKKGDK